MNILADIEEFLALQRIAVVGVSRNAGDFSRMLFRELKKRGYDAVPVNRAATEVEGARCHQSVSAIRPGVDAAIVVTPPGESAAVVRDCAAAGVKRVWLFQGGPGAGAVSEEAVAAGLEAHLSMVVGECPFMFLKGSSWFHGVHAWVRRLAGRYPN
jgi:predicted CoA-binding protein